MHLAVGYNLCSKIGPKLNFGGKIIVILVSPAHFWMLTAFSSVMMMMMMVLVCLWKRTPLLNGLGFSWYRY
jgi:hypothetical protein